MFEAGTNSPHDVPACGGFALIAKMKPKYDYLTPPYFCDIGIFAKVAVTLTFVKDKFEK